MKKALEILKILRDDYIHGELDEDINEAINELEEVMKPKTCDGCKHRSHLDESLTNKTTNGFCVENGFLLDMVFVATNTSQRITHE